MKVKELAELLNFDLKYAYFEIDKITDRLMERVLRIPEEKGWLKIGWVSSSRYNRDKGTVSFKFDPDLKPYLLRLKREFTKSKLMILTQFQSIHSIRIYQLLKQYRKIGHREFRLDELKEILGLKKTQYSAFKDFRRWVLNQAKKEFEKKDETGKFKCDLTFSLETFREGRRIARLKFIIIEQEYHEAALVIVPDAVEQREKEAKPPEGVRDRLIYYGISAKQADGFIRTIGEKDIEEVLTYYADMLKAGKVKNTRGAYLAKLLQEGVNARSPYEKDRDAAAELRRKEQELEKQRRELARQRAEEERKLKNLHLEQRFNDLPEEDRESLLSEFEDTLDRLMLKYFYRDGVWSMVVRGAFLEFLEKRFGGEEAGV
jgi:plasmid replication initiation protein